MEQKKTLWIVAAAGIFLLVVVGAALIIYSPSLHNAPVQQASFDPSTGWVNASALSDSAPENPATPSPETFAEGNPDSALPSSPFDPLAQNQAQNQNPQKDNFASSSEENSGAGTNAVINAQNVNVYSQETTTFDLNSLKSASSNSNLVAQNEKTAEQLKAASEEKSESAKSAEQENYYTPSTKTSASQAKTSSATSSSSKKSSSAKSTSAAAKTDSSKTTSKASSSKTTTAKKVAEASKTPANLYWIQVGAYTSKTNADSARETLEQNKIPVEVFTDAKYFKVRVGPYQTKSEASYWQKMISEIGKFADSKTMIVNSAVQK